MEAFIKITDIVSKTPEQIGERLGKADRIEPVSPSETPCKEVPCDKGIYQTEKYEIVFIDGVSDWITINKTSQYELSEEAITLIGLPKIDPTFNNPGHIIRWDGVAGLEEVSFFDNGSGMIDFIYIKSKTK